MRFITILFLGLMSCSYAMAYDFSAMCESGQILFYSITSNEEPYTVKVVVENESSSSAYSTFPTGDLVVPATVTYNGIEYSVTRIGFNAFYNCSGLTSVTMGDNVTIIDGYAFEGCSGLTSITIPSLVGKIGPGAFMGCNGLSSVYYTGDIAQWCEIIFNEEASNPLYYAHNLYINNTLVTDLVIPESITVIKPYAFYKASCLTSVSLGNSVESIGMRAFAECNGLTEVIISNSVDTIKNYAFENCSVVQSVTIGNSVEYIGDNAFSGCLGLSTVNFNATNCSAMGGDYCAMSNPEYMVFWNCPSLSTVNIGDNVLKIPQNAFLNCESLISVNMGNSVSRIGGNAFSGCRGLTTITIPSSLEFIENNAFSSCLHLTAVYYTGSVEEWCRIVFGSNYQFSTNPLYYAHNLYINDSLLTSLVIPETITEIKPYAFYNASCLTSVSLGNSVETIGDYAFYGCTGLTEPIFTERQFVYMPYGYASEYTIPDGIQQIVGGAFENCNSLASVTIPNSVTSINFRAFYNCNGLTEVHYQGDIVQWCNISFNGSYGSNPLESGHNLYINDSLVTNLTIPESITVIKSNVFSGASCLTSVTIPNTVTSIYSRAFYNCIGLQCVLIPSTVTFIASEAFYMVGSIIYNGPATGSPWGARSVGGFVDGDLIYSDNTETYLIGCNQLASEVTIPNTVTTIGPQAFLNCEQLTSITIPNSVTEIGSGAFSGCKNLEEISIPFVGGSASATSQSSITQFGYIFGTDIYDGVYITQGHNAGTCIPGGLRHVNITGGEKIFHYAFEGCSMLHSVTIPESIKYIGNDAFSSCTRLNSVIYTGSVAQWCNITFGNSASNPLVRAHALYINENLVTDLVIPDTTTKINAYAFQGASCLMSVSFSPAVDTIGSYAFSGCSGLIGLLDIPNTMTRIESYAFQNCNSISSLRLGNSVTYIGSNAFYGCSMIHELTIPNSVITIGSNAFGNCRQLRVVNYNATNCLYMASDVWTNCNLFTILNIGDNVTNILSQAFFNCSGLTSVVIPNSVTEIGWAAFRYCNGIRTVTIGSSVVEIDNYAFDCSNLDTIYSYAENPPSIQYCTFPYGNTSIPVVVPCGSDEAYNNARYWSEFTNIQGKVMYNVIVGSNNNEMGDAVVTQEPVCIDSTAIITAIANDGYHFVRWNDGNTDNPRTVHVSSDTTFVAEFEIVTDIEDNVANEISLFPNPATDILNITSSETISEIEIVNALGQVVRRMEVNADNAVCDVENLSSGVYVVRLCTLQRTEPVEVSGVEGSVRLIQRKFVKE